MQFDYIIIGAGSAGCVLAERLSHDGRSTVLLIEAGEDHRSRLIEMPRGWVKLWNDPRYFWQFPVEPEPGRPGNEVWSYGKGLGGSSAVNGLMYLHGQPRDYDLWEEQGNPGWNWKQISRCFRQIEDYDGGGGAGRGVGGPLRIRTLPGAGPVTEAMLAASEEMGLPRLRDINGPVRRGIGATQSNIDDRGRRVSSADAFLRPALRRRNLRLVTGEYARRIAFDGTRANAVICDRRGTAVTYAAAREIIVCAGVLQSPKLLQLSGIGPASLLREHGIGVVADRPGVGVNMVDHIMLTLSYRLKVPGLNREFRSWRLVRNVLGYYLRGTGLMAYGSPEITGFTSLLAPATWPDFQICLSPFSFVATQDDKGGPARGTTEPEPGISITGLYLRPQSRGSVVIRTSDPRDPPLIHANWLAEEFDRQAIIAGVDFMRELMARPALRDFVGEETRPGADVHRGTDRVDAYKWNLSSGLHGTGTCRMGLGSDAVVDARLRVQGVAGLRVIDCSAMPTAISANTNGPAMAIAWRGAELILEDRDAKLNAEK